MRLTVGVYWVPRPTLRQRLIAATLVASVHVFDLLDTLDIADNLSAAL